MKLQHASLFGLVLGLTCLVAFPSIGLVTAATPTPVPSIEFDVTNADGVGVTERIDGELRSLPVAEVPHAAEAECEEGWGHWVSGPRKCVWERYKLYGPRQFCSKIVIGGRDYHILSYRATTRTATVTPL